MKVSLFLVVLAAVAVGYVTCGSGCKKTRTVLTYNTGLTPLVSGYEARRGAVVKAIKTQAKQADFMCLQELWFEDDMKSVLDKVGKDFPHHYSAIHSSVGKLRAQEKGKRWTFRTRFAAPCSRWSLMSVGMCLQSLCASSDFSPKCITEKCEGRVFSMSQDCRSCAAIASSSALDIMSKCANAFNTYNRVNRPIVNVMGIKGLMILSRQPLTDVQYVNFHPKNQVITEHGYIKAKAEGTPIVCAQLAADRGYYYEAKMPQFSSFEEQGKNELAQLTTTFGQTSHVLMGDLNTGPASEQKKASTVVADKSKASPALGSKLPENYKLLTKYQNDYLRNDGRCTFCASGNPLLQGKKENSVPDHVLVSGLETDVTSAKRVFDVDIKLSDHFGIQQDICLP